MKNVIRRLGRLVILGVLLPVAAWAQQKDVWQYQGPDDNFYYKQYDTAAILQSDGTIAVLAFPQGGLRMETHVGFVADEFVDSLKSTLIDADGTAQSVVVSGDFLKRGVQNENGFLTYHFVLSENDVPRFQRASLWRIETEKQTITYSLKGSRKALEKVLEVRGE